MSAEHQSEQGPVAVITGGSGVIGSALAAGFLARGVRVALVTRDRRRSVDAVRRIDPSGRRTLPVTADVTDRAALIRARTEIDERFGRVDVLVNAAGGNVPAATAIDGAPLWDVPADAWSEVIDLNLLGTIYATMVFAERMAEPLYPRTDTTSTRTQPVASIINISSMAAGTALSRVGGYGAAKAGVESVTRWFAVELARRYGSGLRVNAIAPGFLIGEQNRRLLVEVDGSTTPRGQAILAHTPAGRFGTAGDLVGPVMWLSGPDAAFVTGAVIPVDGGFGAFSGI